MKTFFKAAVFSALCLGLCACGERETPADAGAKNSVLLMGNSADPATRDPSLTTGLSEYKILCALFEGLAGADPKTLEAIPAAAESWSFDGSKYIFKIRGGAKWSDGEPLKASDFVFAFRRTLNPALGAEYANLLFPIKNAKKILEGKERPENLGAKALGARNRARISVPAFSEPAVPQRIFPAAGARLEKIRGRMQARRRVGAPAKHCLKRRVYSKRMAHQRPCEG